MFIKVVMLVVFFAVTIGVGIRFRGRASDVQGFVLGGRAVGPWLTAFAYGTSYFSAVVFVGYAGQFGWKFGISAVWIGIGNAVIGSFLAWSVLGRRTRIMSRQLHSATMPAFFGSRYQSNGLKVGASVIVFIFLIPYTSSLYNGLSRLFAMAFDVDFSVCIIAMAVLTGIYVIAGGYVATAVNDFIQGIIMLFGIIVVIVAVLRTNGGLAASLEALARVPADNGSTVPGVFASFFGPDPFSLLGVIILTSLGSWGLPQMVQKFYSIQSEKSINKGTAISTVFAIIVAGGCYFLGAFGRLFADRVDIAKDGYDAIVPAMLSGFSPALIGVIIILVLAASISTLSSLVMASASTFTLDFLKDNIVKNMSDKSQLFTIRTLVMAFVVVSSIIAIIQYKMNVLFIAQLMGISWGALAGSFLAPFLYGLYWKRASKAAVWVNFLFATSFMTLNLLYKSIFPAVLQSSINAGAFTMLAGFVIVPVVSAFTQKPEAGFINSLFSRYDDTVTVKAHESLGSQQ